MLVYVDESAFSYTPGYRRTYAPKGETPVLQHGHTHGGVQAMSAVSPRGELLFKLKSSSFQAPDVLDFLTNLIVAYPDYKEFLVIWDNAMIHRSKLVKDFVANLEHKTIKLYPLPPYSPQLNADEQVHGYIKQHCLANCLFKKAEDLSKAVGNAYKWLSKQTKLLCSFFQHKDVGFI